MASIQELGLGWSCLLEAKRLGCRMGYLFRHSLGVDAWVGHLVPGICVGREFRCGGG